MCNYEIQNKSICPSLFNLVKKTLKIIEDNPNEFLIYRESSWSQIPGAQDSYQQYFYNFYHINFSRGKNIIFDLKEFKDFKQYFDPKKLHLEKEIRTLSGNKKITYEALLAHIINEFSKKRSFSYDEFKVIYSNIEKDLYSSTLEIEVLTPLYGFDMDSDFFSIPTEDNCFLIKLSEDRLIDVLNIGLRPGKVLDYVSAGHIDEISRFALVSKLNIEKIVDPLDKESLSKQQAYLRENIKDLKRKQELIIKTLRMLKEGVFFSVGKFICSKSIFFGQGSVSFHKKPCSSHKSNDYNFTLEEREVFEKFYKNNKKFESKKEWIVSSRRFNQAIERDNIEDKIIDLMISFESIFFGKYRKSSTFKLALYFSHFLSDDKFKRKELFDFMNEAYNLRSNIVHGDDDHTKSLQSKKLKLEKPNLKVFSDKLENYLRQVLRKLVEEVDFYYNPESKVPIDWNSLIFD